MLRTGASSSFLTVGSGPRLLALEPERHARWQALPRRVGEADASEIARRVVDVGTVDALGPPGADGLVDLSGASDFVVQAWVADAGRELLRADWGDGDLTTALGEHRPPGLPEDAWRLCLSLVTPGTEGRPWWFVSRFHGSCNHGLLPPESVQVLCAGAGAANAAGFAIPELFAFLRELGAVGPRWLACVEW